MAVSQHDVCKTEPIKKLESMYDRLPQRPECFCNPISTSIKLHRHLIDDGTTTKPRTHQLLRKSTTNPLRYKSEMESELTRLQDEMTAGLQEASGERGPCDKP